jgi:CRP-like cAMP-binding protein
MLNRLEPDDRADLLAAGFRRLYAPGATIIHEGDDGNSTYLLLSGRVKVSVTATDGHESVLCVLGPGELLGEFESIVDEGGPRTADNVALEAVECRVLRGVEFRAYLESHPRAALVLLGTYVRRLRHSDRRRADVLALDTNHRVARILLEQVSRGDVGGDDGIDVDLPLTQEELAGLAAASRESVVRALTSLRSRGLITTARRRITVRDLDGLRKYAG